MPRSLRMWNDVQLGLEHVSMSDSLDWPLATRREALCLLSALPMLMARPSQAGQVAQVGAYLPPAGVGDFVLFVPDSKKTPALRAGTVNPSDPYKFAMPPTFREGKVANILSGNFCQPNCAEPWTEVVFEDEATGKVQVLVSPLVKLTNKPNARIQDVGEPNRLLDSVGPFITGTYLDDEDVVSVITKEQDDGRTYYYYEINAPYGTNGPHTLTAMTTKGELALLFIVSATDKQWSRAQGKLRQVVETFRA